MLEDGGRNFCFRQYLSTFPNSKFNLHFIICSSIGLRSFEQILLNCVIPSTSGRSACGLSRRQFPNSSFFRSFTWFSLRNSIEKLRISLLSLCTQFCRGFLNLSTQKFSDFFWRFCGPYSLLCQHQADRPIRVRFGHNMVAIVFFAFLETDCRVSTQRPLNVIRNDLQHF